MSYSFDERIQDKLQFVLEQIDFIQKTTAHISRGDDFSMTMDAVILFNSTCMCLQTIGESLRSVDRLLGDNNLAKRYPDVPWRQIFGLRNIISHEYAAVDTEEICSIIKNDLAPLAEKVQKMMEDKLDSQI